MISRCVFGYFNACSGVPVCAGVCRRVPACARVSFLGGCACRAKQQQSLRHHSVSMMTNPMARLNARYDDANEAPMKQSSRSGQGSVQNRIAMFDVDI